MVATSQRRLVLAFLALLAALALTACARPMGVDTRVGGDRWWFRLSAPKRVMVSTYERTPAFEWRRFVIGPPSSPALSLFRGPYPSCAAAPRGSAQGLSGPGTLATRDVAGVGPLGAGVAGAPTMDLGAFLDPERQTLTWSMLERASWLGVTGDDCGGSVFAYVRLGLAGSMEPVAVAR
ncbi:MAG: hypothetical protein FJ098_14770 [Deltaproteobacteria bacterium]|nr:hypothetical protein [Deltaproteobacteria bacterium]